MAFYLNGLVTTSCVYGDGTTYTASATPSLTGYIDESIFWIFMEDSTNVGACTLNIDGLGAKNLTKSGYATAPAGAFQNGAFYAILYYGGSTDEFRLVGSGLYEKAEAKVACYYDGVTQTIRFNHNVASITWNATGDYTINFAMTFANTDYAVIANTNLGTLAVHVAAKTTTNCRITTKGLVFENSQVNLVIYGDCMGI